MASVVRAVLLSREFDAQANYFARYSWPVEYVVRALKEVGDIGYPLNNALGPLTNMGQQLFEPPDVGGWSLGASWFSTAAMLARMNFASKPHRAPANRYRARGEWTRAHSTGAVVVLSRSADASAVRAPLRMMRFSRISATARAWTGNDTQLRVKAPGLLHVIVGSSEYQLV